MPRDGHITVEPYVHKILKLAKYKILFINNVKTLCELVVTIATTRCPILLHNGVSM